MPDLDAFDLAILDILQRDNATPQRLIGEAVSLSASLPGSAAVLLRDRFPPCTTFPGLMSDGPFDRPGCLQSS
jgi:hypothetical protein